MPKRSLYDDIKVKNKPKSKKPVYRFELQLFESDFREYDFKKMIKFLAMEWGVTMKDAILLSVKDAFLKLTKNE